MIGSARPPAAEIADALFEIGMLETYRVEVLERRASARRIGRRKLPSPEEIYSARRRAECIVIAHEVMRQLDRANRENQNKGDGPCTLKLVD